MVELLNARYRLRESIGAGGSAHVFRARDERLGRDVAVKLLDDDAARSADPAARQRFEKEARAGARFVHANAVTVFDAGSDQGRLFLVMELVTGGSLAERLARSGRLDPTAVAALGAQIGGALAAGHAAGLLHRDVKPSNVLFTEDGTAKLADFGIARRFDEIEESLTDTGMVMGTRQYVSPEQAAGQELTAATDQFSLGVTLFEAVTGTRPPNAAERGPDVVLDPSSIVPGVPAGLAAAITTATAMRIERRFASMSEMTESIAAMSDAGPAPFAPTVALASGAGGSAPPSAPASRSPLSADLAAERRRRRIALGAGVAVAIVAIGLVAFAAADDGGESDAGAASVPASATAVPSTTVSTTTSASTTSTTIAATTTSTPPTTSTTIPPTTIAQLIPGFAVPADEREFLATLRNDPELAGSKGDDLVKRFEKFLDAESDDRDKEAERVQKDIDKWLDKNEIDPTIAATASSYLEVPSAPSENSDDED